MFVIGDIQLHMYIYVLGSRLHNVSSLRCVCGRLAHVRVQIHRVSVLMPSIVQHICSYSWNLVFDRPKIFNLISNAIIYMISSYISFQ